MGAYLYTFFSGNKGALMPSFCGGIARDTITEEDKLALAAQKMNSIKRFFETDSNETYRLFHAWSGGYGFTTSQYRNDIWEEINELLRR